MPLGRAAGRPAGGRFASTSSREGVEGFDGAKEQDLTRKEKRKEGQGPGLVCFLLVLLDIDI